MKAPWTPMRWPSSWADPSALDLLKGSGIDTLLVNNSDEFEGVRTRGEQAGLRIAHPDTPPDGARIVKGEWPGVRQARGSASSAGPTGVPWVDSNGWVVQLSAALHGNQAAWIDAAPPKQAYPSSYLTAVADASSHGGRWIVTLDEALAEGIKSGNANAQTAWKNIREATAYFAAHKAWEEYRAAAVVGVISSFVDDDEFFGQELLNLLARAGAHTAALRKDRVDASAIRGLRAVVYADEKAPEAALRKEIVRFVEGGGLLITTPVWGEIAGGHDEHPRFRVTAAGKGRIARAIAAPDDPYQLANDAVILVSHRYDLVRFWNAGAVGSSYLVSPDGKQAVVHLLFYANRGPDTATVRVAGPYRKVKASMVNVAEISGVQSQAQKDAVEVCLPRVSQYVALELSV